MTSNDRGSPLDEPPEADAAEQRQSVDDDPDAGAAPATLPPDATDADVAEQGVPVAGERDGSPPTLPADANAADVLEQRATIVPDEERRD